MQRAQLPHQERLEQAFGESLDGITAYTGAGATLAMIGARAAATPETVHFGDHAPDLHTTAHEVAHVLQYRHATAPAPAGIGAIDSPAETDAHQAADAVVRGQTATVTAPPAANVQMLPFGGLIRRIRHGKTPQILGDAHVEHHHPARGGSLNRVDPIEYNRPIDSTGSTMGYFKPTFAPYVELDEKAAAKLSLEEKALLNDDPYTQLAAMHAIFSTTVDKLLGFNLLPEERFARHADPGTDTPIMGSVAPEVIGEPLIRHHFGGDLPMTDAHQRNEVLKWVANNQIQAKVSQDAQGHIVSVKAMSSSTFTDVNFSRPITQKGLWDLQLLDSITGETDRHGGNIIVNGAGAVHGIDNDRNLRSDSLGASMHYPGLPALVDEKSRKRVLKLSWSRFLARLNAALTEKGIVSFDQPEQGTVNGDPIGPLGRELQTRLRTRYLAVQEHLRSLPSDCIIKRWNDVTYQRAINGKRRSSYLWDAVANLKDKPQIQAPDPFETQAEYDKRTAPPPVVMAPPQLGPQATPVVTVPPQLSPQTGGVVLPAKVPPRVPARQGKSGWVRQQIAAFDAPGH